MGILDTRSVAHHWATMSAADRAHFDPVGDSFTGLVFAQLAFGVLGVLTIGTEYGTGMIRATLTATPRRGTVFTAKAVVLGAVTLRLPSLALVYLDLAGYVVVTLALGAWRAHRDT